MVVLAPVDGFAQAESESEPTVAETQYASTARTAAAALVAAGPGLVVHGAGHFVLGETQTGWTLLATQAAGLGGVVVSIGGLAVSGAAAQLVTPLIGGLILGAGALFLPYFADLYGVLAPEGGFGSARPWVPPVSASVGYRYVNSPLFEHSQLLYGRVEAVWGPVATRPTLYAAVDDDNWRTEIPVAWRVLSSEGAGDYLELEAGYARHRFGAERFTENVAHGVLRGRLDLDVVGPTLQGSFVEAGLGQGYGWVEFDDFAGDDSLLLLGELAWGFYLGHGPGYGEFALYYDHRHDGYVGGLKSVGVGSGTPGHFGARIERTVIGAWGLQGMVEVGSSVMTGVCVVYTMEQ